MEDLRRGAFLIKRASQSHSKLKTTTGDGKMKATTMMKALAIASLMAYRGLKRKSLTRNGAVAAFLVGFLSLSCGPRGSLLLLFYLVSCELFTRLPDVFQILSLSGETSIASIEALCTRDVRPPRYIVSVAVN